MDRDALAAVPEAGPQATVPLAGVRKGSFRALRSRPFRLYFAGQVVSASGTFVQQTAIDICKSDPAQAIALLEDFLTQLKATSFDVADQAALVKPLRDQLRS